MKGEHAGPVRPTERLRLLDAMRGFALLGILFVNLTWFTGFAVLSPEERVALGTESIDAIVYWLINVLVDSKFWTLFALLFGVGIAIQSERAQQRGVAFAPLFVRRMLILLLIGLAHAVFIWFGDIVSLYAFVGLGLLLFLRCDERRLLGWGLALVLSPIAVSGAWLAVHLATVDPAAPAVNPGHGPAEMLARFSAGTYLQALDANWQFLVERWVRAVYTSRFLSLLGIFLLGFYVGRRGVFHAPERHGRLLRRVAVCGLLIGIPANVYIVLAGVPLRPPSVEGWLVASVAAIGHLALALAYASLFTMAWSRPLVRRMLSPLAFAGRLSLTNYVLQSVVGVAFFYGYGLGWWGRFGITWGLVFLVALFGFQVLLSAWWLRHFAFGPLEWVWRCLTYGRRLPLRAGARRETAAGRDAAREAG